MTRHGTRRMLRCALLLCFFAPTSQLFADARSTERLSYICQGKLGQRDITVFANGTVRLREGLWDDRAMFLAELGPDELRAFLSTLDRWTTQQPGKTPGSRPAERQRSSIVRDPAPTSWNREPEERRARQSFHGEWAEDCSVKVALPGRETWSYDFSAYDVPPLEIGRVIQLMEELVADLQPEDELLPLGYIPRRGEILRNAQGERYRVLRLTSDERGVELEGLDQPLVIYVALSDFPDFFRAVDGDGNPSTIEPGRSLESLRRIGIPLDDSVDDEEEEDEDEEGDAQNSNR